MLGLALVLASALTMTRNLAGAAVTLNETVLHSYSPLLVCGFWLLQHCTGFGYIPSFLAPTLTLISFVSKINHHYLCENAYGDHVFLFTIFISYKNNLPHHCKTLNRLMGR